MRDDTRPYDATMTVATLTAGAFVREVAAFRAIAADPRVPMPIKSHAWAAIVRHASILDPNDVGFQRAGVALKEALCVWLDIRPQAAQA